LSIDTGVRDEKKLTIRPVDKFTKTHHIVAKLGDGTGIQTCCVLGY
jgi:hypothetical protein